MAAQDGDTVTVKETLWRRVNKKADAHEKEVKAHERESVALVKEGKFGSGIVEFGGAYAPLVTAGIVGAVLYYIAENKTFREMEWVKKHWWVRGVIAGLIAIGLWRKGYAAWATAVASAAMGMLIADYKNRETKEAGDPEAAGETGYWIGDRWVPHHRWDEPRLEMARERWDERLAGLRRAEETTDRVFMGG